jgi:hypothetical protein
MEVADPQSRSRNIHVKAHFNTTYSTHAATSDDPTAVGLKATLKPAQRADIFPDRRRRKSIDETRFSVTSLRTAADALLRHVRNRWSIENSWHWPRDTQLDEDEYRYGERNGVSLVAILRSLAMNTLRLGGLWSITHGLYSLAQAASHGVV